MSCRQSTCVFGQLFMRAPYALIMRPGGVSPTVLISVTRGASHDGSERPRPFP